jgi:hypothetical protein
MVRLRSISPRSAIVLSLVLGLGVLNAQLSSGFFSAPGHRTQCSNPPRLRFLTFIAA